MSVTGPATAAFANKDKLSFNPTKHDDSKMHLATEWHGKQNIQSHERPVPVITDDVRLVPQQGCVSTQGCMQSILRSNVGIAE